MIHISCRNFKYVFYYYYIGDHLILDYEFLFEVCEDILNNHKNQLLSDDDLCLKMINILHCDLLPVIQLKPNALDILRKQLMKQNSSIEALNKKIIEKTGSRATYGKSLDKQITLFVKKFSKSMVNESSFCTEFGKKLLSHVMELLAIASESEFNENIENSKEYERMVRKMHNIPRRPVS